MTDPACQTQEPWGSISKLVTPLLQAKRWSYPVSVDRSGLVAGATPQFFSSYTIGHS